MDMDKLKARRARDAQRRKMLQAEYRATRLAHPVTCAVCRRETVNAVGAGARALCRACSTARAMLGSDAGRAARLAEWLMLG